MEICGELLSNKHCSSEPGRCSDVAQRMHAKFKPRDGPCFSARAPKQGMCHGRNRQPGTWVDEVQDVQQTGAEDRVLNNHPGWGAGFCRATRNWELGPGVHRKEALRCPHNGGVVDICGALHVEEQHEDLAHGAQDDLVSLHHLAEVFWVKGHIRALAAEQQVVQVRVVMRGLAF